MQQHDGATDQPRPDALDDLLGPRRRPLAAPRGPQHQLHAVVLGRGERGSAALPVRRAVPPWQYRGGAPERGDAGGEVGVDPPGRASQVVVVAVAVAAEPVAAPRDLGDKPGVGVSVLAQAEERGPQPSARRAGRARAA